MRLVQRTPSSPYLGLVSKFVRSRRPTKLDESRIRSIAQVEKFSVDPPTLPPGRPASKQLTGAGVLAPENLDPTTSRDKTPLRSQRKNFIAGAGFEPATSGL
jgi:hypothetical protein